VSKKRKKPKDISNVQPQDVLSGRISLGVFQLIELIHRINPTDRDMTSAGQKQRYQIKSQLQSRLIQLFGAELEVVADGQGEGVVSIRHRSGAKDACHAVLDQLTEDARAWVNRRLDEMSTDRFSKGDANIAEAATADSRDRRGRIYSNTDRGGPTLARDPKSNPEIATIAGGAADIGVIDSTGLPVSDHPEELRQLAQSALEQHDYDFAKQHFIAAYHRSGHQVEFAIPLFELLVDFFAAYEEALEIAETLTAKALKDETLKALLAKAAAFSGKTDRALQLVDGLVGTDAARVYLSLASDALRRGDLDRAAEWIKQGEGKLESADGSLFSELDALRAELATARANQRAPQERELARLLEQGDYDQTESAALRLLAQWPESRVARKALNHARQVRQRQLADGLRARAEESLRSGAYAQAADLLRRARELGDGSPELEAQLAAAEQQAREDSERNQLVEVLKLIREPDRTNGLLAYFQLDDSLRARLRAEWRFVLLDRMEEIRGFGPSVKAQAAVDAVLALESAANWVENGHPQEALSILDAQDKILGRVTDARILRERARDLLLEHKRIELINTIGRANDALDRGDYRDALQLLERADLSLLSESERERADGLVQNAQAIAHYEQQVEQYQQYLKQPDILAARDCAARLVEIASAEQRPQWIEAQARLAREVRALWGVRVIRECAERIDLRDIHLGKWQDRASLSLTRDGRQMVAIDTRGIWLFIRFIDIASHSVTSAVILKTPKPLGRYAISTVKDNTVWISGEGKLLAISLHSWEVLRWLKFIDLDYRCCAIDRTYFVPSSRFLWGQIDGTITEEWWTAVIDLDRWNISRELSTFDAIIPIWNPKEPFLICSDDRSRVYTEKGSLSAVEIPSSICVEDATASADGNALVMFCKSSDEIDDEAVSLVLMSAQGVIRSTLIIDHINHEMVHSMATCAKTGLVFLLAYTWDKEMRLLACRTSRDIKEVYDIEVPGSSALVRDETGRYVALLAPVEDGVNIVPLDSDNPPILSHECPPSRQIAGVFSYPFTCAEYKGSDKALTMALVGALADQPIDRLDQWIQQARDENADDVSYIKSLFDALQYLNHEAQAKRMVDWMAERHRAEPLLAVALAEYDSKSADWNGVLRALYPHRSLIIDHKFGPHACHLLIIALLKAGRTEEVLAALEKIPERPDSEDASRGCDFESLSQLAIPFSQPITPQQIGPDKPLVRRLWGTVLLVDNRMKNGQVEQARQTIDQGFIWRAREVQSSARLADVYLRIHDDDPAMIFFKTNALAFFCEIEQERHERYGVAFELPLPRGSWANDRLEEIAEQSVRWLDQHTR